jgi:hypothetical protein
MNLGSIAPCAKPPRRQKSAFTAAEDIELTNLVHELGQGNWHLIEERLPGRTARQCRERWSLYLAPDVVNTPWTPSDDLQLVQLYQVFGPKWTTIAKHFTARTANQIKNRQKQLQRKVQRITRFGPASLDPGSAFMPPIGFPVDADPTKVHGSIVVPISQDLGLADLPGDGEKPGGL